MSTLTVMTTVSSSYAEEIKTPFYGEKLEGLMQARSNCLSGIVNGIDYGDFNPATDTNIARTYSVENFRKEKVKNKMALQEELGLERDPQPYDDRYRIQTDRPEGL